MTKKEKVKEEIRATIIRLNYWEEELSKMSVEKKKEIDNFYILSNQLRRMGDMDSILWLVNNKNIKTRVTLAEWERV